MLLKGLMKPEETAMDHISMKLYADEKISNARRMADIQREVNKANSGSNVNDSSAASILSTLKIWLLKTKNIRSAKREQPKTLSDS
jgi:hypothetical protein